MMRFSVLMAVYYKENPVFLEKSLNSLIDQTFLPEEVIIVKDGPLGDELEKLINGFTQAHPGLFKILSLPTNMELGIALAKGLKLCKNELIARMDSDDICYSNRFEKQIDYMMANPHVSVVGSSIREFNCIPGDLTKVRSLPEGIDRLRKFAVLRNPLHHPTVVFRKSHVLNSGGYKHMPLFEDYYLWVRMLKKGYIIANIKEPLLHFRTCDDMIRRRHGFSYLKKELFFLKKIKSIGFINTKQYFLNLLIKIPLKLIPKRAFIFFYKNIYK